jgi:ubiquinone/menaquinone biosynthesis C-methylase UbiE
LKVNGKGIDVYKYDRLTEENIVKDIRHFPFDDQKFDTVTFIANLNHVPSSLRDIELAEAYRVLKPDGNILVTMANPLALIMVHKVVAWYDTIFKSNYDVDHIRGMHDEEAYYIRDEEIRERLTKAGFINLQKHRFASQWGLNWVTIGWKSSQVL